MDAKAVLANLGKLADLAIIAIPQAKVAVEIAHVAAATIESLQATTKLSAGDDRFATEKREAIERAINDRVDATADRLAGGQR